MIRIRNLEAGYGKLTVLKGISLHVEPGEIVAIIGSNGAGKTTLLNTIAGLIRPSAGEILLSDHALHSSQAEQIVSLGVCLVPEGRQVFSTLSVRENLTMGAYLQHRRRKTQEIQSALERVYFLFPILEQRHSQLAGKLSGGEQQMLAMARALMSQPRFLMMDEPSMGIAPLIVKEIFRTISLLREAGITVLLVEQNARAALRVADRGYVLETGSILLEGTAQELLDNQDVQRAYLGKDYARINE